MSETQRTFVIIKPDAVRRGLVGTILARYEAKGLAIVALTMRTIDADLADQHYRDHIHKGFYSELRQYITSGPLLALVLQAPNAVAVVRLMNGATNGDEASPGSIRGDFGLGKTMNLVHASDSVEAAAREIALWFPELIV